MDDLFAELTKELGLDFGIANTVYTIPDQRSVDRTLEQANAYYQTPWIAEEIFLVLGLLDAVDTLNRKYMDGYNWENIDESVIVGLKLAYDRALGCAIYGFLQQFYEAFGKRPKVYQSVFGPSLGRVLLAHSLQMKEHYKRLNNFREEEENMPGEFTEMISGELKDINAKNKDLAVSLGLPAHTADKIQKEMFYDQLQNNVIDIDVIKGELNVSASEHVQQRIRQGKEELPSEAYANLDDLLKDASPEKRKKIMQAMQAAKDKDRVNIGRRKEKRSSGKP